MTPEQERRRERFEALIAGIAPALDLILAAGDRVSRRLTSLPAPESKPALGPGRRQDEPEPEASP